MNAPDSIRPFMNRSVCCIAPTETIEDATRFLTTLRLSTAPVVDDHGFPIGIVSVRDLVAAPGTDAVFTVMSQPCVSVRATVSVHEAAHTLLSRGIHHVCVVDAQGAAIGFLGSLDLLSAYHDGDTPPERPTRPLVDEILSIGVELDPANEDGDPQASVMVLAERSGGDPAILWLEATRHPRMRVRALTSSDASHHLRAAIRSPDVSCVVAPLGGLALAQRQPVPKSPFTSTTASDS